jgi:hypothetical protein
LATALLVCLCAATACGQGIVEDSDGWGFVGGEAEFIEPGPVLNGSKPRPERGLDGWVISDPDLPATAKACDDCPPDEVMPIGGYGAFSTPDPWDHFFREMRFHHSSIDGRSFRERPIHGTSWLNRPFHVGVATGGFFMTQGPQDDVRNDNDLFGAVHLGWDWDYYWGLEGRIGRATPELINRNAPTVSRSDSLMVTDISLLYYPQGDTVVRPYLRAGIGWTDFDVPNDDGTISEASPFTIPFGLGVKWPVRRWLAARLELVDNLAIADSAVKVQNNVTLVFGMEYRWGAKPKSYWPWDSSWSLR